MRTRYWVLTLPDAKKSKNGKSETSVLGLVPVMPGVRRRKFKPKAERCAAKERSIPIVVHAPRSLVPLGKDSEPTQSEKERQTPHHPAL